MFSQVYVCPQGGGLDMVSRSLERSHGRVTPDMGPGYLHTLDTLPPPPN